VYHRFGLSVNRLAALARRFSFAMERKTGWWVVHRQCASSIADDPMATLKRSAD
jgi:hypothetical protein